jgi:hypothetical protein
LFEQRHHDLLELNWIDNIQNLLDFVEEHDLFGRVDFGPVLEQAKNNFFRKCRILFEELHNTVCQLRMVKSERFDLVKGYERASKECLMFFFQWQRETIDDGSENFKQFCNAIVSFGVVNELEEDVCDRSSDECT